ncbi:MAG: hypothetical protein K1X88_19725 [Nannocystaceae bacterium]|nr:hypothetical protein [Nannocystaceae bacterium]
MIDPSETLSRHEADEVLRRAVDIHQREAAQGGESLTVAELQRLAGELGIRPESVQRALVEVRSVALARTETTPSRLDRWFGAAEVTAARAVPGPRTEVDAAIDAMLRAELFRIERNHGDTVVWENPDSLLHRARRLFDVGGRLRLGVARRVTVTTQALGDAVHVRLVADLAPRRDSRARTAGAALVGWSATGALVASLLAMPTALVPLVGGVLLGGAFAGSSRRTFRNDVEVVRAALERFLDFLERERVRL